ncbi:MAG: BlaI/MecI/CopY family transcriptional regulator [bacterium]|nr:BlaI/MecI/CopY family transcriptional regulator [bacterium]
MGRTGPHVTEAELRVLKDLWTIGKGTVRHVLDALPDDGGDPPAYTTVMTLMKQLADKGALKVDRERQPFVYKPAVRRDRVLGNRVTQFLQSVFDGRAEDLVLHLAKEAHLSAEDLRRIEASIEEHERAEQRRKSRRSK